MKNMQYNNPKDERVTNDDNAATNKDGNNDLEKGEPSSEKKAENTPVKPDNDSAYITSPAVESTSNKGQGPAGENL